MSLLQRKDLEKLKLQLVLHEGIESAPYKDTEEVLTWGVGRNLQANPLTEEETLTVLTRGRKEAALIILESDITTAVEDCQYLYNFFSKLCPVRQRVLIDMAFNLGRYRLSTFKCMTDALENRDYESASKEMLDSKWAVQVGNRARTLSSMMETGDDIIDYDYISHHILNKTGEQ